MNGRCVVLSNRSPSPATANESDDQHDADQRTGGDQPNPTRESLSDHSFAGSRLNLDSLGAIVEEIQYSGTIVAGDALAFDGEQCSVTKNGTAVNFSGSFPFLEPGGNNIKFTITATSFSATATVKAKDTYL